MTFLGFISHENAPCNVGVVFALGWTRHKLISTPLEHYLYVSVFFPIQLSIFTFNQNI